MKTLNLTVVLVSACTFLVSHVSAALVVNGDFEAGYTGFTSEYTKHGDGGLTIYDPETYVIAASPRAVHTAWPVMQDHTPGGTQMLIINGADDVVNAAKKAWIGRFSPDPLPDGTYVFSAWIANLYSVAPAELSFSIGNTPLGKITVTDVAQWQQFTATFTVPPTAGNPAFLDLTVAYNGNDVAVDDISVSAVPEPATYIAGALLLLPIGMQTIRRFRK